MSTRRLTAVACVVLLTLVGCRDRSTEQTHQDKRWEEVGELDGTVAEIAALDASPGSVARLRALRTEMEAKYRDVQAAAQEADAVRTDAVTQAYNRFVTAVRGVNDPAALAQAEAQIDQAAGELSTARLDLHNAARC